MLKTQKILHRSAVQCLFPLQKQYTTKQNKQCDMISPADPISNLHHIKYAVAENETPLEVKLRKCREELQNFNKEFWTKHNTSFIQKKRDFEKVELEKKCSENQFLTADEISVFYKKFLDDNWKTHLQYLLKWYKSNFYVTFLHLGVKLEKLFKKR